MNKPGYPTIDDVARAANVSTATISRAINTPTKVAKPTRERIEALIQEMGYTPNHWSRVLASKRSNTIGAIIPTMANSMFASGLQAFQERLAESDMTMLVASTGYDSDSEWHQIRALVAQGVDGLLLIGESRTPEALNYLKTQAVPYVISWSYRAGSDLIFAGFDNYQAAANMATTVLNLGHRHIGILGGVSNDNDRARQRIDGFKNTVEAFGDGALVTGIVEAEYSVAGGGNAFDEMMRCSPRPTAIVCGNDVLAAGAIVRANERNINVPCDVSITGFDDIDLASVVQPSLTTVQVPQTAMGRAAAELLLEQLSDPEKRRSVEVPTQIIRRHSLAALHST